MTMTGDLPVVPFQPAPLSGVPAEYADRRARCPLGKVRLRSGHEAVLVVRHDDAVAALGDVRISHDLTAPGSARLAEGPSFRDDPDILLNIEGERHRRLRRIAAAALTPRSVRKFRPKIEAIAHELIDHLELSGQPADLEEGYCAALPTRVITTLLGLTEEHLSRLPEWSAAFALAIPMTPDERTQRLDEFTRYISEVIAQRRAAPGDDLIDDLIAARDGEDRLSERELPQMVMMLIVGAIETTHIAFGLSMLSLLRDDGVLWRRLVGQPGLIPNAVEELLRYNMIGDHLALRVATDDVELPSGTVHRGEPLIVAIRSALTDDDVYPDPKTVIFEREIQEPIYFGGGPHFCLGAHLAKAELEIGLAVLTKRLAGLRVATDVQELRFTEGQEFSALIALPVTW